MKNKNAHQYRLGVDEKDIGLIRHHQSATQSTYSGFSFSLSRPTLYIFLFHSLLISISIQKCDSFTIDNAARILPSISSTLQCGTTSHRCHPYHSPSKRAQSSQSSIAASKNTNSKLFMSSSNNALLLDGETTINSSFPPVQGIKILHQIGAGSYGTVHLCKLLYSSDTFIGKRSNEDGNNVDSSIPVQYQYAVAKRAWTLHELQTKEREQEEKNKEKSSLSSSSSLKQGESKTAKQKQQYLNERAKRCKYYLDVEEHCLGKLLQAQQVVNDGDDNTSSNTTPTPISNFLGRFTANDPSFNDDPSMNPLEWIVFELITTTTNSSNSEQQNEAIQTLDDDGTQTTVSEINVAKSLKDIMAVERSRNDSELAKSSSGQLKGEEKQPSHHHLYTLQKELGISLSSADDDISLKDEDLFSSTLFDATLDTVMKSLLDTLKSVHEQNIVHRDIKPDNLLVDGARKSFVLIDFGSAADIDPIKTKSFLSFTEKRIGLEDDSIVAISPIYAAPETFVKLDRSPLAFDTFSAALIFCQLLFNLLDERTDAAFRQQLQDVNFNLDFWLEREIATATVRPDGLDDGLAYLGGRPGLWNLLKDMLNPDPEKRITSKAASQRFETILNYIDDEENNIVEDCLDGGYFQSVIASLDICSFPPSVSEYERVNTNTEMSTISDVDTSLTSMLPDEARVTSSVELRPLHFIATFERKESLGLILSEVDDVDEEEDGADAEKASAWKRATKDSMKGDVFIRDIVEDGQADQMGIFEVGDKICGVSGFPIINGGFENVVEMLGSVPKNSKTVKVHFVRKPATNFLGGDDDENVSPLLSNDDKVTPTKIISQGAWSTKGRRKAQEDTFLLHEINQEKGNEILLSGVFDGHGGDSASQTALQVMPNLFVDELKSSSQPYTITDAMRNALSKSWDNLCDSYRDGCSIYGSCVADYDSREGIIYANTGSADLVAGTTATVAAIYTSPDGDAEEVTILNCGDSRALMIGSPTTGEEHEGKISSTKKSVVHFVTRDHSPNDPLEMERLRLGKEAGLDYSQPQCSVNRWFLKIGQYQYAICRGLEGNFALSKGITSEADITSIRLASIRQERNDCTLVIASDGLFEVLDNEQVGRECLKMRRDGLSAEEVAKNVCGLALEKDTTDNVSVVVVFFE